jgi:enamine deaminase RidA (YjgF/YER057c/UK114 family)
MPTDTAVVRYLNPPALERPPGYSHVVDVRGDRLVFVAGQAGVDATGTVVGGDSVEAQAEQAFRNLSMALESVGCTAANLVKLTVFVRDMDRLADYRRARDRFFNSVTPADRQLSEIARNRNQVPAAHPCMAGRGPESWRCGPESGRR